MPKFSSGAAKVRRLFPAGGEIKKLVQVYAFLNLSGAVWVGSCCFSRMLIAGCIRKWGGATYCAGCSHYSGGVFRVSLPGWCASGSSTVLWLPLWLSLRSWAAAFTVSSMWRKCIFLVLRYICFEDMLDYMHFVTKPLFYRHFAGVQQGSFFQVFVNQVFLCAFSAGLLLKGRFSHDEVRMCGSCRCRWTDWGVLGTFSFAYIKGLNLMKKEL